MKAMKAIKNGKLRFLALGFASVILLIAGYYALSVYQHAKNPDDTTIPTFSQIWDGVKTLSSVNPRTDERWILVDSVATGKRLFLGVSLGVVSSVLLGLMMGCFRGIEAFFITPLSLLAKLPPTAALAVFFVMAGTDMEMYVAMIAFGILPTMAQTIYLAVKDLSGDHTSKGLTLGASRTEIIWNVIFLQILPKVIDSIRLQIGPAVVYLIAAEMVCGDMGFGYRIRMQSRLLNMNVVYPYLAFLAAFGFAMDWVLRKTVRLACPWYVQNGGRK